MFFRVTTDTSKRKREKTQTNVDGFSLSSSTREPEYGGTFFRDDTRRHNLTFHHSAGVYETADELATGRGGTERQIRKQFNPGG